MKLRKTSTHNNRDIESQVDNKTPEHDEQKNSEIQSMLYSLEQENNYQMEGVGCSSELITGCQLSKDVRINGVILQNEDHTSTTLVNPKTRISPKKNGDEMKSKSDERMKTIDDLKGGIETLRKNLQLLEAGSHKLDLTEQIVEKEEMDLRKRRDLVTKTRKSLNSLRNLCITEIDYLQKELMKVESQHTVTLDFVNEIKDKLRSNRDSLINIRAGLCLSKDESHTDKADSFSDTGDRVASTSSGESRKRRACTLDSPDSHSINQRTRAGQIYMPMRGRKWSIEQRPYARWTHDELKKIVSYVDKYNMWEGMRPNMTKIVADVQTKKITYPFRSYHAIRRKLLQVMSQPKFYERYRHDDNHEI